MPPRPPQPRPRADFLGRAAPLLLIAAALAAGEIAFTLFPGRYFEWGRAEALLFYAVRPWLLVACAVAVARRAWRERAFAYACYLGLATAGETLLIVHLGAREPWWEAIRGLAAGVGAAAAFDVAVQAGLRWGGRFGRWLAGAVLLLILLTPLRQPYDRLVLGEPEAQAAGTSRPRVLFMSGLPLVWGEGGPFDTGSRPAAAHGVLAREFDLAAIDTIDPKTLSGGLLLLAQPQRLSPEELTALDAWVRGGGRALIFADPQLAWPSELPLGDIRRPPPVHLLSPLLTHWGIAIEPRPGEARKLYEVGARRLAVEAEGLASGGPCAGGLPARCRIGRGRATVVGDADLFRDDLWAPAGPERHRRTADNPLIVAAWLDELAEIRRPRSGGEAAWRTRGAEPTAILLGLGPPLVAGTAGGAGLLLRRRRRG
jgi:hypothetical protein